MKVPDNIAPGHDTVDYVFDKLSEGYQNVLPNIKVKLTDFMPSNLYKGSSWGRALDQIQNDARSQGLSTNGREYLSGTIKDLQDTIEGALNAEFDKTFPKGYDPTLVRDVLAARNLSLSGEFLKKIESSLSGLSRGLRRETNVDRNQAAPYVDRIRDELRNVLTQSNPEYAPKLQAINEGYAAADVLRRAAAAAGTNNGVFTGAQLSRAVKSHDPSVSKTQFARGKALLQDLSSPAAEVMRTFPDSGTTERGLTLLGLGAGTAYGLPTGAIAAGAAIPGVYNPYIQRLLRNLATAAPQTRQAIVDKISKALPYAAPEIAKQGMPEQQHARGGAVISKALAARGLNEVQVHDFMHRGQSGEAPADLARAFGLKPAMVRRLLTAHRKMADGGSAATADDIPTIDPAPLIPKALSDHLPDLDRNVAGTPYFGGTLDPTQKSSNPESWMYAAYGIPYLAGVKALETAAPSVAAQVPKAEGYAAWLGVPYDITKKALATAKDVPEALKNGFMSSHDRAQQEIYLDRLENERRYKQDPVDFMKSVHQTVDGWVPTTPAGKVGKDQYYMRLPIQAIDRLQPPPELDDGKPWTTEVKKRGGAVFKRLPPLKRVA